MSFKRVAVLIGSLLLTVGLATSVQAAPYTLTGGGGQTAIGGGLPLPIQLANPAATGTVFPTLLVPPVTGKIINGTTAKTVQQELQVPATVLSRPPAYNIVGVFGQNPNLYAVATNLGFQWPAAPAVFNTTQRTGAKTTTFITGGGNNIRYSNPLPSKFGGPAQFKITQATGAGPIPAASVTIYAIAVKPAGNPPCVHTALTATGGNPACVAALGVAVPNSLGAVGAPVGVSAITPGGIGGVPPAPGIGIVRAQGTPLGTITTFVFTPTGNPGFTNMASTVGYPWTTGQVTVSAPLAPGAPELFTIRGGDSRTAGGAGTIQMVAGALGQRPSGPNANRGWVRLDLAPAGGTVPALSPVAQVALLSLIVLVGGYAMRRRLFSVGGPAA